ncbi:thermonuclease family protein [Pontibacillus salicampi]|uniref:Thermonuclease family protein n=1 Tax=Pontibacillus salicampi TaxID=1449801 RepID=A0ABV6LLN8_9BACI
MARRGIVLSLLLLLVLVGCGELGDASSDKAVVTRVVDGDTMKVELADGTKETVRLLLVDTPETKHPELPVQAFGPEAAAYAEETLSGENVTLHYDESKRDTYDRLLVYLHVNGVDFNKSLIEKGLARVAYVWEPNTERAESYYKVQQKAKQQGKRIWSIEGYVKETEDGGFRKDVEADKAKEEHSYDPFGADRDCSDFSSQKEAQHFFQEAGGSKEDPHRLDGSDQDGIVCEGLP